MLRKAKTTLLHMATSTVSLMCSRRNRSVKRWHSNDEQCTMVYFNALMLKSARWHKFLYNNHGRNWNLALLCSTRTKPNGSHELTTTHRCSAFLYGWLRSEVVVTVFWNALFCLILNFRQFSWATTEWTKEPCAWQLLKPNISIVWFQVPCSFLE